MIDAFLFRHAFLPDGFASNVRVRVEDGSVLSVEPEARAGTDDRVLAGIALPGLPNLHSHAFQRGMAGLAERRGPGQDSFWTWREVMYRFLGRLAPDDVEAIAALAYLEMLERGFTGVGEFHYLHHDVDGRPYYDQAEMAGRIVSAAGEVGIGLTLLPCLYVTGNFGSAPPTAGQRRFINDLDGFARLLDGARRHAGRLPGTAVGIAPHSLRAVPLDRLAEAVALEPEGPIHMHAAEQLREVEDCLAATGRRPVELLLDELGANERWCLIHATHMSSAETERLAFAGTVAGLCPITEASLGDGVFDGARYLGAGGRLGLGTDSNIDIDATGELRQLEYSQRLTLRARNVMTTREGESTGQRLFMEACAGGARALARPMGRIAPGCRADLVVLDQDHPAFAGAGPEHWLDAWIFAGGREAIATVIAGGRVRVEGGRHVARDRVLARYRAAMARLAAEL